MIDGTHVTVIQRKYPQKTKKICASMNDGANIVYIDAEGDGPIAEYV